MGSLKRRGPGDSTYGITATQREAVTRGATLLPYATLLDATQWHLGTWVPQKGGVLGNLGSPVRRGPGDSTVGATLLDATQWHLGTLVPLRASLQSYLPGIAAPTFAESALAQWQIFFSTPGPKYTLCELSTHIGDVCVDRANIANN